MLSALPLVFCLLLLCLLLVVVYAAVGHAATIVEENGTNMIPRMQDIRDDVTQHF